MEGKIKKIEDNYNIKYSLKNKSNAHCF